MVICTSGNAVITSDNGNMIHYKYKCPSCGYVDSQERLCSVSSRTSQMSSVSCPKCRKPFGDFKFERR